MGAQIGAFLPCKMVAVVFPPSSLSGQAQYLPQSFTNKHKAANFTRTQMPHGFSACGSCRCWFSSLACIIFRLWPIPHPQRRYPRHILPRYTLDAENNNILLLLIMPMDTRSEDKWYCHHIGYGCSLRNEKQGYNGYEDIRAASFFWTNRRRLGTSVKKHQQLVRTTWRGCLFT